MTDTPQPTYIGGLTWDKQANAAYLAIRADEAGQRHAAVTLRVGNENGTVVAALDFRADGTLMGVEAPRRRHPIDRRHEGDRDRH
ncbi:DUF2283 domain-containing protein [Nocardia abscessus]|uniref:DUF2283 domain-containing protein n=1 Tax=Nocardia abscessus TaxID=120957 RepID=UPI002453D0D4|nr:DUF2283 domain-containing protein [Nocardia abscessus]